MHPRLELDKAVLQTVDSALCLLHDGEMVPSAGFAPAPPRSQRGMLLLHYEGSLKWSLRWGLHPHDPVYETGALLCRPRRSLEMVRHVGAAPTRRVGLCLRVSANHEERSRGCIGAAAPTLASCCYIDAAVSLCWPNWGVDPTCLLRVHGLKPMTPFVEMAVGTGAAPAVSSLTRRRVCCFSSRP